MTKNPLKKATLSTKCVGCGKKLTLEQVAESLHRLNNLLTVLEAKSGKPPSWFVDGLSEYVHPLCEADFEGMEELLTTEPYCHGRSTHPKGRRGQQH